MLPSQAIIVNILGLIACILGLVGAIIGIGILIILYLQRDKLLNFIREDNKSWQKIAELTELSYEPGVMFLDYPFVEGLYRNRKIRLDRQQVRVSTRGCGEIIVYTRISLSLVNDRNVKLTLKQPDLLSKLGDFLLRAKQTPTLYQEFNQRFFINVSPEEFINYLLEPSALRQEIFQIDEQYFSMEVTGNKIRFRKTGIENDVGYLLFLVDLLNDIADRVESFGKEQVL